MLQIHTDSIAYKVTCLNIDENSSKKSDANITASWSSAYKPQEIQIQPFFDIWIKMHAIWMQI